jgi:hypothetical protein
LTSLLTSEGDEAKRCGWTSLAKDDLQNSPIREIDAIVDLPHDLASRDQGSETRQAKSSCVGFGAPIKAAGSLSQMVSIPTVLTGFMRHYRAGALSDHELVVRLILPMGLGAVAGGIGGGLLANLAPSSLLKAVLGVILIASSIKVFAKQA